MNLYAFAAGIFIALYVAVRFRKTKIERKKWAYPLLLATFPAYYWVFAVYSSDYVSLQKELLVGVLFIGLAFAAYKTKNKISLLLLATGYIGHAAYDVVHDSFFINTGTPIWWPEFCGAVDGLIGLYLAYLATTVKSKVIV